MSPHIDPRIRLSDARETRRLRGYARFRRPVFFKDMCLDLASSSHRSTLRNLRAFVMTDTEDKLIAAAAIIGDRRSPVMG